MNSRCFYKCLWPLIAIATLGGLFVFWFFQSYEEIDLFRRAVIVHHVKELADIFKKIDVTCGIVDFEHEKNYIDFLTIKKGGFVGSEVGSMNLRLPKKWEGPYVQDNPTVQEKYYVIIMTPKAYYVAPGDGVKVEKDLVIGKNVILDKNSNFEELVREGGALNFKGKPMALKIKDR